MEIRSLCIGAEICANCMSSSSVCRSGDIMRGLLSMLDWSFGETTSSSVSRSLAPRQRAALRELIEDAIPRSGLVHRDIVAPERRPHLRPRHTLCDNREGAPPTPRRKFYPGGTPAITRSPRLAAGPPQTPRVVGSIASYCTSDLGGKSRSATNRRPSGGMGAPPTALHHS